MNWQRLMIIFGLTLLVIWGCSKKSSQITPPNDDHEKALQKIDTLVTGQTKLGLKLDTLLSQMTETAAKDSLVKILQADPSVSTAKSTSQGITIQYTNGMRGGIILNFKDDFGSEAAPAQTKLGSLIANNSAGGHKPSSKKTIFLNPSYWQRQAWADPLVATANKSFAKAGYDNFEVYLNDQCTIAKFISLSGYGIVHIYTHGWAWPDDQHISEVYALTGEVYSAATTDKYLTDIQSGKILMGTDHGGNHYWISPSFFAAHNNFSDDTTLFYGGFCYSGLGGWKDTVTQIAKAAAYVGFDWHVQTSWNAAWARHLYTHMCDTSMLQPMPLAEWRSADPDTDNTYFDNEPECQKWVSVWYQGYGDLVLWRALKIVSVDPPAAPVGETVRVRGAGFGASKGTSTITFNGVLAVPISWSDTLIVTPVPVGASNGNIIVTVGTEHTNPFAFRLAELTISIDADTVWMLPSDTTHLKAIVTGSADTTVIWSVLEQSPSSGWFYPRGPNMINFQVSNAFVGIGHVIATAHADATKKDTVVVVVSVLSRLQQTPYIYCRFDGAMIFSITCSQSIYDLAKVFTMWNSQQLGMPTITWEGNHFSIDGEVSFNSTPWVYYETLQMSGTVSPMGDTLRNISVYFHERGNDPYFREWSHRVEATNVPLSSFSFSGSYNMLSFDLQGPAVQSHITRLEDYYHETGQNGICLYERLSTSVDWNSAITQPRLKFQFDIVPTTVKEFGKKTEKDRPREE